MGLGFKFANFHFGHPPAVRANPANGRRREHSRPVPRLSSTYRPREHTKYDSASGASEPTSETQIVFHALLGGDISREERKN
jgi:hypothetical protein